MEANEKKYSEYLKDKHIVLVGPALYLAGQCRGGEIDKFDVVVRMNNTFSVVEQHKDDIGSRLDVLYLNFHAKFYPQRNDIARWAKKEMQYIITQGALRSSRVQQLDYANNGLISIVSMGNIRNLISREVEKRPNMGLTAIIHLLTFPIKTLTVMGCDFYQTGYVSGYRGMDDEGAKKAKDDQHKHDMPSQIEYLSGIWQVDDRLVVDDNLRFLLSNKNMINQQEYIKKINQIKNSIRKNNDIIKNKPHRTPIGRNVQKKLPEKYVWRKGGFT